MTSGASLDARFWAALGFPLQVVALKSGGSGVKCINLGDKSALQTSVKQAAALNAEGWNLYYEVNVSSKVGQRSTTADITHLRAIVGDIDAKSGRTIEECREAVGQLPLHPSFVIHSGGGLQIVYLLNGRPAADESDLKTYEAIGRALADLVDGDAVFDAPRLMRLPGFTNHPTPKKAATGRTAAKAQVETATGETFTLSDLAAAFIIPPATAIKARSLSDDLAGGLSGQSSGFSWFDLLSPADKSACLASMLQAPAVAALADTSDGDPSPNWRTVLAACARSGAPDAYALCRACLATSDRFDPRDFERRWNSYANV